MKELVDWLDGGSTTNAAEFDKQGKKKKKKKKPAKEAGQLRDWLKDASMELKGKYGA